MKRISMVLTFILLALTIGPVQAGSLTQTTAGIPFKQYLRLGFNLKSLPIYVNLTGREASLTAEMQSVTDQDVYFAFPAAAEMRVVSNSAFYLLNRSGTYTGSATMALEVRDTSGNLKHKVSTVSVDLQSTPAQIWTTLSLSNNATNCLVESGEFLVFHLSLDGAPGGSLVVNPLFEVTVGPQNIFLPLIMH